ncbi:MAG: hypothetical protein RLZZ08_43 [Pseudomonadota bacterium]
MVPYLQNQGLTIIKRRKDSPNDASGLALAALGWILSDGPRAERFLGLTGLTPDGLRAALAESGTHRAVLDFLCAHEPDLVAAAEALDIECADFAGALQELDQ